MGMPTEPATLRLSLEVNLGEEPISGTIEGPTGQGSGFSGWLELIGALERFRERGDEASEKSSVTSTMRPGPR